MDRRIKASSPAAERAWPVGSTIAVVGASARAAAMSVLRSGRRAVAADLFADADLQRACPVTRIANYPEDFVDWLRGTACDAWLYTGALENHPDLVDEMALLRPLLGNPGQVLRRVRDPLLLQQTLRGHGFAFPETRTASEKLPFDGTWLAKTYRASSGSGVTVLDDSTKNCAFFQRFITGDSGSAVFAGGNLLGVTRQLVGAPWTGAKPFHYCGSLAPWALPADALVQLQSLGSVLVEEFGLTGLFGVDFVFDGSRPWIVEVNPRYTAAAEVVELATCENPINWHVASHHREGYRPSPAEGPAPTFRGKAILFSRLATAVSSRFTRWALDQSDLADIPTAGSSLSSGQPVLTVLAEAKSFALILPMLKSRMGEVVVRLWGEAGSCDWVS